MGTLTGKQMFQVKLESISMNNAVNTIIIGDFNYGDINWKTNVSSKVGKEFLKACNDLSLKQCVKNKTRGKNILDLVLVYDKNILYKLSQIAPIAKSDHNTLSIVLNVSERVNKKQVKSYGYNKANYSILSDKVNMIDWEERIKSCSVNEFWDQIINILQNFKENSIPKFCSKSLTDVPWLNGRIKKLIKNRDNLYKRFNKNCQPYSRIKYITARNKVTKQVKLAKKKYEFNIIKRSRNNRKVFYTYVSRINRKNGSKRIGPVLNNAGKLAENEGETAKLLNDYFSSVFTIDQVAQVSLLNVNACISDSLSTIETTENMIIKMISSFKEHKSPGIDGITSTYAIKSKDILAKALCLLFNKSIDRGEIPEDWKKANITPIFKTGDKCSVENYRPVSLTSFYGKVLEKIIKVHIEEKLIENNFVNRTQHGFSKGRSCLSNLLICHDSITRMIDDGSSVDIIYLDFQKAFDKVPHNRLIAKVRSAGIDGKILDWIIAWLEGRTQRVGINGSFSDWIVVTSGVPQGSILGPLLFTIYINDLEDNVKNKMLKFADDSKIWGRADTLEDRNSIQQDLEVLSQWSIINKMPFNVKKCKVMHIGKNNEKMDYKLMGSILSKTTEEKDLGVFVSENFKPTLNCNKCSKAANRVVGLIRRNISSKGIEGMMILYKSLVRPLMDYCIQVWKPYAKKDMKVMERVQKRFTKMIDGCKDKNYVQRLEKLGITTLEERYYRADMLQVYKILKDDKGIYPDNFLVLNDRPGRKNSVKLFKERSRLDLRKFSFTSRVVDHWNALPDAVILAADVNAFKSKLDKYMRDFKGQL